MGIDLLLASIIVLGLVAVAVIALTASTRGTYPPEKPQDDAKRPAKSRRD